MLCFNNLPCFPNHLKCMRKFETIEQLLQENLNTKHSAQATDSMARCRLQVSGVVQGVGFRPFLHNLAHQLAVSGWVRNTSTGVEMEIQGAVTDLERFVSHLQHDAPPLAHILTLETTPVPLVADQPAGLEIRPSHSQSGRTLVSPDVATCTQCLSEVFDPADRRYHYAFTNCTHCGPRFTIILDLPYDRPYTTMAGFPLCPDCASEYKNTGDRRFHAQPVACPKCGPVLWYTHVDEPIDQTPHTPTDDVALAAAIRGMVQDGVVALKGLGGFHLACRADSSTAINRLRASKNRPAKPLAVMMRDVAEARKYCHLSPAEEALLTAPEAPIVLLRKRADAQKPAEAVPLPEIAEATPTPPGGPTEAAPLSETAEVASMPPDGPAETASLSEIAEAAPTPPDGPAETASLSEIAEAAPTLPDGLMDEPHSHDVKAKQLAPEIAPQNGYIGVMLPYTPLHHLLLQAAAAPLVMTSGNRRGEPLCIDNAEAKQGLSSYCDGFIFHNRPIARRCDDSVMFIAHPEGHQPIIQPIRRSRGLAPLPVLLPKAVALDTHLVAAGADLKNVPALAVERQVFLTQHIGDMENLKAREEHAHAIADFEQFFRIQPQAVVCDLHPNYASTRYARERAEDEGLPLLEVQHHHAHIAACLAENDFTGPAIGLSFDGTGYGTDGHIWGSEVLLADLRDFQRCYHLEYLPLPGGDAATRHPYRIALAYMRTLLPEVDVKSLFPDVPDWELSTLEAMLTQNLNTPLTSSMGRLFDAVSALLGLCWEATHEAQAAIALEDAALNSNYTGPAYPFELAGGQIRLVTLFAQLVEDRQNRVPVPDIARRFHQTVAEMSIAAAQAVRTHTESEGKPINQVALSGGVWQNRLLLDMAVPMLQQAEFEVLLHHTTPANDGGLAYGQVAVAAARLQDKPV
jgi:hydrogenase maturation protein HypF